MNENDVVIIDALRTPIGNFNGSLNSLTATELGSRVIRALISNNKLDSKIISEVIMAQVLTGGAGQNPARQAAMKADVCQSIPAWLVSQVCGSSLKSIICAYQAIKAGDSQIVIAGGQESMSNSMHAIWLRNTAKMGDNKLIDMMLKDGLNDAFEHYPMGVTAENIVKKYNISRQEQDEFAFNSQSKASIARNNNVFKDEIIPITVKLPKESIVIQYDEAIRENINIENLSRLRPIFETNGTVTAGNSSPINDGAAALLLMSYKCAKELNYQPIARIVSWAQAGVDPKLMGIGPVYAVKKALAKADWTIDQLALIEANEAFAAQAIAVNRELNWDLDKVNISGGAIALGHPIGASGARIMTSLIHALKNKSSSSKALASLCIGGGMGIAICIEKI